MKKLNCGLIVSDFDGTLLTSEHEIPERVRNAINEYVASGGIFAVCTGRMLRSILPRVREMGLTGIVAAYQGGVIADIGSGKIIKTNALTAENSAFICRTLKSLGCFINVYSGENLYTDIPKDNRYLRLYENITGVEAISVSDMPLADYVVKRGLLCQKVASLVDPKEQAALYDRLTGLLGDRYDVTCSANCLIEISPLGDDKGAALEFLAEYYGVDLPNTVAIGDNLNDLSMIEKAGYGVAVGNAADGLKAKADFICVSNDECAVAQVIEKYGFKD